jgi:PTS system mannitol-specific IIA component
MSVDASTLLAPDSIRLNQRAATKEDAVRLCGQALVSAGAVDPAYVDTMLEREASMSTFLGEAVAIPHGTLAGKDYVHEDALCFLRFPEGIDWGTGTATLCIGIAAKGDGHLEILAQLAQILLDPERADALRNARDPETVLSLLTPIEGES